MDTPPERHPARNGLIDSGYVVSVVRSGADLRMHILGDTNFVGLTLPGNPCDVLVCCTRRGAEAVTARLADGIQQLDAASKQPK